MTTETLTDETKVRRLCDRILEAAATAMSEEGAPIPMILDRLLTYAAAQACQIDGVSNTATTFRRLADNIEGGAFARFEQPKSKRH